MIEASTVESAAKTVPNLDAPLCDLSAEILGEWDSLNTLVSPMYAHQRERLERFRRRIEHHVLAATAAIGTTTLQRIAKPTAILCNDHARADLLPLEAGYRIPLHDHPGGLVMLVPLAGRVIVSSFQVPEVVVSGDGVKLSSMGRDLLGPGDFSVRLPTYGNAHKISALIDAVLLELIVSPCLARAHHRFIPLEQMSTDDGTLGCFAIGQAEFSPRAEPCNAIST